MTWFSYLVLFEYEKFIFVFLQIVGEMTDLLEWFQEVGQKILNSPSINCDVNKLAEQIAHQKVRVEQWRNPKI